MNFPRLLIVTLAISTVVIQSGCGTRSGPAPVVDRSGGRGSSFEPVQAGFYRIKPGDTLLRIALDHGQSHRDIAEWNNIADMNQIEVDQVIRVVPPRSSRSITSKAEVKQEKSGANKAVANSSDRMKEEKLAKNEAAAEKSNGVSADAGIKLSWPSKGNVIERFSEGKNKGIDISGKPGDPIQAAADGKVVYAGNSLRGYGNLVIVKHDNTYLTAYAHNKTLLVKEGDSVKKAQKIAEMGNTDADQVKLHFEVRKHGKPVDPMSYLP